MHANHFWDSDRESAKNMICGILTYDGLRPVTPEAYYVYCLDGKYHNGLQVIGKGFNASI